MKQNPEHGPRTRIVARPYYVKSTPSNLSDDEIDLGSMILYTGQILYTGHMTTPFTEDQLEAMKEITKEAVAESWVHGFALGYHTAVEESYPELRAGEEA